MTSPADNDTRSNTESLREARIVELVMKCTNGPDEHGHYPCDPQILFSGDWTVSECQACGRFSAVAK